MVFNCFLVFTTVYAGEPKKPQLRSGQLFSCPEFLSIQHGCTNGACLPNSHFVGKMTGWWFGTCFSFHILGRIIPTDFHSIIFQRGRSTTKMNMTINQDHPSHSSDWKNSSNSPISYIYIYIHT